MRRILAALVVVLLLVLAGCGAGHRHAAAPLTLAPRHALTAPSESTQAPCRLRLPAEAGECIRQQHPAPPPKLGSELRAPAPQCVDISVYQGVPDFRAGGVRCVIIQANDGGFRNRLFDAQVAAAKRARIPWGVYTFLAPGESGSLEATVALAMSNHLGRSLGLWADAEVSGAYEHACEYVGYARAGGVHIYGVYSSPGLWPGYRCAGYIWPAEWSSSSAQPLPGYPSSAIKVRQWCGTCRPAGFPGEVDRDEALGIIALSHIAPTRHQQLVAAEARVRALLADLHRHGCFSVHGRAAYVLCPRWGGEWRAEVSRVNTLRPKPKRTALRLTAAAVPTTTGLTVTKRTATTRTVTFGVSSTEGLGGFKAQWRPVTTPETAWSAPVVLTDWTREYTFTALPSSEVQLQVRALVGAGAAQVLSPAEAAPTPPPAPAPSKVIVGVNGASDWGAEVAAKARAAGITSDRVELGWPYATVKEAVGYGFTNLTVIVGNTDDGVKLSATNEPEWLAKTVAAVKAEVVPDESHVALLEDENEPFLKGGQAEPALYGKRYLALKAALAAAGVKVPLGFALYGDYKRPDGSWSQVAGGNGWDADAIRANPGLAAAIGPVVSHPYGPAGANKENDWGPGALKVQLAQLTSLGVTVNAIYDTEFGIEYTPGVNGFSSASTEQAVATELAGATKELAAIPNTAGLWDYELHDPSSTNKWGLVAGTWSPRPALSAYVGAF